MVVVAALSALAYASGAASAKQIIPLHEKTEVTKITTAVTGLQITGEATLIKVVAGNSIVVTAHKGWNFSEPTTKVTVSRGIVKIDAQCNEQQIGPAYVSIRANDCYNEVTVAVPATVAVSALTSYGPITTAGLNGGQTLHTGSGDVGVRDAHGGSIIATSGYGAVSLTAADLRNATLHADSGDVTVNGLRVGQLAADTGYGSVRITNASTSAVAANTGSGDVNLTGVSATIAQGHSDYGVLVVADSRFERAKFTNTSGDVDITLKSIPTSLTMTSGNGMVNGTVPKAVYDVRATSNNGNASIKNLVNRSNAPRHIRAHTDSGDVSIIGA